MSHIESWVASIDPATFTDQDKLTAIAREIALRKNVYVRRVAAGQMTRETAAREIAIMRAIESDYRLRIASAQ
jgi:hypothetical protein